MSSEYKDYLDNGLAPKRAPQKRAKVMGKARERVVKTEIKLQRSERAVEAERARANAYLEIITNIGDQSFTEQLIHDLGRNLGHYAAEEMKKLGGKRPELFDMLMPMALELMAQETGNNMAKILAGWMTEGGERHYHISQDPMRMGMDFEMVMEIPTIRIATRKKLDVYELQRRRF